MNLFDILQDILLKKDGELDRYPEFDSVFSSYMLARYLSMKDDLLLYAEVINHFNTIGIKQTSIYRWAYDNIPKQKTGFIKYIKKAKKKEDSDE